MNHSPATDAPLVAVVRCKNGNYSAFNLAGMVSGHESLLHDVAQREPTLETPEACVASCETWYGPLAENATETARVRRIVPTVDFAIFTPASAA
jgi:hypothetical protein